MSRYLIVAHQTAESPELIAKVQELAQTDWSAEFTVLVPSTPVQHLLTWWEGEKQAVALTQSRAAASAFRAAGALVSETLVGDASPIQAIHDEPRRRPDYYDAIVVCTFPPGLSRWLQLDLPSQARRTSGLPVIHIEAQPASANVRR